MLKSENNKVAKATIWYLICDIFIKGLAFFTMPILNRLLSLEENGLFNSWTSWIGILSVVFSLNLVPSVFLARFDFKDEFDDYVSTISSLGVLSSLFFVIICFIFRKFIYSVLGFDSFAFFVIFSYLVFCQMPDILNAKYRVVLEYKKSVILSLLIAFLVTGCSLFFAFSFPNHLHGRLFGNYIPFTIVNFLIFLIILFKGKHYKIKYCKYALAICLPLIIHNLSGNIMHFSDRIMIERIKSAEESGLYSVAYSVAMIANLFRNSMNSAWEPWVYEKINSKKTSDIKEYSYIYLFAFFALCSLIVLFAPEGMLIIGGKKYIQAIYVIPPVVSAYMFSMIYSLYASVEQYYKKQKFFAFVASFCAILNIILNYILIPRYGYVSAAYTSLLCMGLECVLHYFNVKKMGLDKLYNTRFNIIYLLMFFALSSVSILLYKFNILRLIFAFSLIFILIILIAIYRKKIAYFIREIRNKNKG